MSQMQRNPSGEANSYVPKMQGAGEFDHPTHYSLGAPTLGVATTLDTDIDADAVAGTETPQTWISDVVYGRVLTMSADADPGSDTVVDVYGRDYLGQPMIERFTMANAGTTLVVGKKAFYSVNKTVIVTPATNAVTANLGDGDVFGLPYRGDVIQAKEDNALVALTGVVEPVYTDPQTPTTGDPRGTYAPIGTPNGSIKYVVLLQGVAHINAAENGGLHGIAHYFS